MKKIINGKSYDTVTARKITGCEHGTPGDFAYCEEELYCKRTGEYFLAGSGGPMSKYSRSSGQNSWSGGSGIIPLTLAMAREWAEREMSAEAYEREFGPVTEDDTVRLNVSMPADVADLIRKTAQAEGISVSECIARRFR